MKSKNIEDLSFCWGIASTRVRGWCTQQLLNKSCIYVTTLN